MVVSTASIILISLVAASYNSLGRSGGLVSPDGQRGGDAASDGSGDGQPEGVADLADAAQEEGRGVSGAVELKVKTIIRIRSKTLVLPNKNKFCAVKNATASHPGPVTPSFS